MSATSQHQTAALCNELQSLLLAENPAEQRRCLLRSFNRLKVAGFCRFSFTAFGDAKASLQLRHVQDLSGELNGLPTLDLATQAAAAMPAWLVRWVLGRKQPFWLGRYMRFIPFSSALALRATAPEGRQPLRDFLVVVYPHQPLREALMIGLLREATQAEADQLITIASAFLIKAISSSPKDSLMPSLPEGRATPTLSARQIECLRWLVAGKSLDETATITGMSYANVRYHLTRAKKLTGFASQQQLLAFAAVEYGLSPLGKD